MKSIKQFCSAFILFLAASTAMPTQAIGIDLNVPAVLPPLRVDPITGTLHHVLDIDQTAVRALKVAALVCISLGITGGSLWMLYKTLTAEKQPNPAQPSEKKDGVTKKYRLSPWAKKTISACAAALCSIGMVIKADAIIDTFSR